MEAELQTGERRGKPAPAWLQSAIDRYARKRRVDGELIRMVVCGGRDIEALTGGERTYLGYHRLRYRKMMSVLPQGSGQKLLDVGSYPGHLALLARIKGWNVSAISLAGERFGDTSFENRMVEAGIDLRTLDIERERFPFNDECFDAVFFNETLEHLAFNPFHALSEIWRVLRREGMLILSVPNLSRFDVRWSVALGRSTHLPLSSPMEQIFPADICHRHIREYTPREVRYLLQKQDRYLYRFKIVRMVMDRSWDGTFFRDDGVVYDWRRIKVGTVMRDFLTRIVPSLRGNIIVTARRPGEYWRLKPDQIHVRDFLPAERTGAHPSFVRDGIRAGWMQQEAQMRLSGLEGYVDFLDLLAVLPAPPTVAPRRLKIAVGENPAWFAWINPSPEPRRIRVPVRRTLPPGSELTLRLFSDTWIPSEHGIPGDSRPLSVMISFECVGAQTRKDPVGDRRGSVFRTCCGRGPGCGICGR